MEKNQTIGFLLMGMLLLLYFLMMEPPPPPPSVANEDSLAKTHKRPQIGTPKPTKTLPEKNIFSDSIPREEIILENKDIKVRLSSHCACIREVELKNYQKYDGTPMVLLSEKHSQIKETISVNNQELDINTLQFEVGKKTLKSVLFSKQNGKQSITRQYSLDNSGFQIFYQLQTAGTDNKDILLTWHNQLPRLELSKEQSNFRTTINYFTAEDFDYLSETASEDSKENIQSAEWVSMKQKFFNSALIGSSPFVIRNINIAENDNPSYLKTARATLQIPYQKGAEWRYYFGPNDYNICKQVSEGFEQNVYLGWSVFAFLNLYGIIPLFEILETITSNYGIVILILVIIIKTAFFPLTYKSYVSMAKMRVLKPELDYLKEKFGKDPQRMQQEQLKIYSQFGVNPLTGCIPMLVQMPVWLAMFNFFPNAIQLRQEQFLWAKDLSTYDSILDLSFDIPFYGDHVSLFTLLMTASTILYTYYNNQVTATPAGTPAMLKYMGYLMPIMFLFFLNSFSAGLTYYYFIANVITIAQQLIIRKLTDDTELRKKLDAKKQKNQTGKKSSFRQRLEAQLQEQQKRKAARQKNRQRS